ncbi:uncharacterized protein LOC111277520 [Durio zibethinus]|uniref:Uncharacterized protein LOC111277520 n=1 Tax=Durio zibethinus TaxID=66656 RepID=A0A6P5WU69_DURZI|nr:uncharacterized protein LOC111277520 [Durio zibethinus]
MDHNPFTISFRAFSQQRCNWRMIEERGKEGKRSYEKLGKKKSLSLLGFMTSFGKGKSSRSVVRKKLYKSSIQKAKEILQVKMMKTGLENEIQEKRVMVESLKATIKDAAETETEYRLLKMRRNELRGELISGIKGIVRMRATEMLLMEELDLL